MTADSEDRRLPTQGLSQRIGQEAVSAFGSRHPNSWNVRLIDGDDDFGIDAQAQVADEEGKIVGLFHAQIKGSRTSQLNSEGTQFSVPLSITTLNYYARIDNPIMLVFSDLSVNEDPRSCPVYWTWVTEDIRELLAGRPDFSEFEQETITFHVPIANKLERDFDITGELLRFRRRSNALTQLCHSVSQSVGPEVQLPDAIAKLAKTLQAHPGFLATIASPIEGAWVEPEEGSIAAALRDCQVLLERSDDDRAAALLDQLSDRIEDLGTDPEKAEREFLLGRIQSIRGAQHATIEHYSAAANLNPGSAKYRASLVEAKFIVAFPNDLDTVHSLITDTQDSTDEVLVCIRARLQAAVGETQAALETLSGRESFRCSVARALIMYLQRDWSSLLETCQETLEKPGIKLGDQSILTILLARAHYYRGVGPAALEQDGHISPFGNPDMDLGELWEAWKYTQASLELLRTANWPSNVEHIVDVVNVLAVIFNKQQIVLNDLDDLSSRRPQFAFAHETLHRLAALAGDDQLSLKALDRLPDSDENLHLRILSLYGAEQHEELLGLAEERLLGADPDHHLRGACLGTAALASYALLRHDRAKQFEEELASDARFAGDSAVFRYIHAVLENPLSRAKAAGELYGEFVANPSSVAIQDNLFPALDAQNVEGATRCLEVSNAILERRRLSQKEVMHLAQAQVTLNDWNALQELANIAITQYGQLPSLVSLRALAQEGLGNTAGALQILEAILQDSPNEELALDAYINICARNGFQKEALRQVENLLQLASDRSEKTSYLQQIWGLEMAISPDSPRLLDIAQRYGALCDQDTEEEEGIYLQMFLMSTLREEIEVSDDQQNAFQSRAERFFERFPNSAVFKKVELPTNLDGENIKAVLNSALGYTPEADAWFRRVENQLQRGTLAVPYAWLPRRFLRNIPDLAYLWAIARTSSKDAHAYHLTISPDPEYKGADLRRGLDQIPLMDLTTLLVLNELELFDVAFEILKHVGITKQTLAELQRLSHPFFGGYQNVVGISNYLQRNIDRVVQPGNLTRKPDRRSKLDEPLEEIKQLAATRRYSLYVDDLRARQYIQLDQDEVPSITTIDILIEGERRGILTAADVSKRLAKLIACKVIIPVKGKYFLAAVPGDVDGIDDVDQLLDILNNDETFTQISSGLWDFKKDYEGMLKHAAFQLANVARSHAAKVELIAAIWETWLSKVKFRPDLPFGVLEHAARCLVLAAALARDDSAAVKRLWDAYILVVHIFHGERMDEAKEAEARELVGNVTARIAQERDPDFRDTISGVMTSGLREGTEEFERFSRAYAHERGRLAAEGTES